MRVVSNTSPLSNLALETKAPLILLDESAARLQARQLGLTFTGVLGLLRKAKPTGRIPSLKQQIDRLRAEARFFVSPTLEKALLISAGEKSHCRRWTRLAWTGTQSRQEDKPQRGTGFLRASEIRQARIHSHAGPGRNDQRLSLAQALCGRANSLAWNIAHSKSASR
jgi:Domain of unknown function (DUF3368)